MPRSASWLLGCVALCVPSVVAARPLNILLVVVDTLRADGLGVYGDRHGLTPNLDRLARQGTVFTNAYAPSSWTCPSVASLFTSRYASQHGVVTFERVLADDEVTLAERLQDAGYVTGGFSANCRLITELGYGQGFRGWYTFVTTPGSGDVKPRAAVVRADSLAWLRRATGADPQRPIFLYYQFMEPHAPYKPPAAYRGRAGLPPEPIEEEATANAMLTETSGDARSLTPEAVELLRKLYEGEVASADAEIGALLDDLQNVGFLDRALVIITADHGEEFGEHGVFGHGYTLFNQSIHIPLIVIGPDIAAGRVVTDNVSLLDVAPTVLDLAGVPAAPTFEGHSLFPLMRRPPWRERLSAYLAGAPAAPAGPATGEVVSELERTGADNDFRRHVRTLINGSEKLVILPNGNRQLFDLASDPGETAPQRGAQIWHRGGELLARLQEILTARPATTSVRAEQPLDDATKERLRALGYHP